MKKIVFVNQRYGLEVNGGSEYYTRIVAEHLTHDYEVHVFTTKAVDYVTWKNEYVEDHEIINDVIVHRFPVLCPRNPETFNKTNEFLLKNKNHTMQEEEEWVKQQGPCCPSLISYIDEHKKEYSVFVFVTYLYYTTVKGLPEVAEQSILIPTAHDEPYIYFDLYKDIFKCPRAIVYLTDEERKFVHQRFRNTEIPYDVMAVGIDVAEGSYEAEVIDRTDKINAGNYIIYVGRIDEGKNCHMLFRYFEEYKRRNKNELKLVLIGKAVMEIPKHPDIISLGFVEEKDKFKYIYDAKALVLPSAYESLSIAVLEALAIGTPVITNGTCDVLKGHCVRSNAGLYYCDYFEFEECINYMIEHPQVVKIMKENGKRYIEDNYTWKTIIDKFVRLIDYVGGEI